jgi:transposase
MRPPGSPQELERRRHRALALLAAGALPVDVARRLGVDRRSVRRWKAAHRARGVAGVRAKPASGRPPKLTGKQRDQLERVLLKGATAAGFATPLWTCPRIATVIARHFQVHYHPDHVGRLLHGLGWSPQQPARRALERDEAAIAQWVKGRWPQVKKTPRAAGPR